MERYTTIPSTGADLSTLAAQMLAKVGTYSGFNSALLTAKKGIVDAAITANTTNQTDADSKNALYVSARNVYRAAADVLAVSKASLNDGSTSLRNHIESVVASVTAGMTAEQLATFETDCGIALAAAYLFLAPVAPTKTLAKKIDATSAFINWTPSEADDSGHCAAKSYLVEDSADGSAWAYVSVVTTTEIYVTFTGKTHFRIKPFGDAGEGTALEILVADFDSAD